MTETEMRALLIVFKLVLVFACIFMAGFWAGTAKATNNSPTPRVRLAPPVACTMNNRMDIFVDEEGVLWECKCEPLATIHICKWTEVWVLSPTDFRRINAKIAAGKLPHFFWWHAKYKYLTRPYVKGKYVPGTSVFYWSA